MGPPASATEGRDGGRVPSPLGAASVVPVTHPADAAMARAEARAMAAAAGLDAAAVEEMVLVASELATNLVRHAGGGRLVFSVLPAPAGLQIESIDSGPGINDVEAAFGPHGAGHGSLGYGLGTVHRLTDELEIASRRQGMQGVHLVCRRWRDRMKAAGVGFPLDLGAATRPLPGMAENGDAPVLVCWAGGALAGVIDGLGHGQFAHRAARTALHYVQRHADQPLEELFRGVQRSCRATRGVVMALARFDLGGPAGIELACASVGNVEMRMVKGQRLALPVRRGILGFNAPGALVARQPWSNGDLLVIYSDGIRQHGDQRVFADLAGQPATAAAQHLLRTLARDNDDATVVVVKSAKVPPPP